MVDDVLHEFEEQMKKVVESLRHTLASIRTGRASPGLVEHLQVDVYGMTMPLNQLAGISVPESRLITIQPYDASTMKAIEKAIQLSDLGLNPNNDGKIIRLALPQLTEERRRDLVKQVRVKVEDFKVSIRNHRRDSMEDLKQLEAEKLISEDDLRRAQEKVQQLTDRYTKDLEQIGAQKEIEVMEV
ncbi:MAG: ribosome recycling factor [Chloroflexaceae bacterium]|nr:ribosome recycling factor [Chloroflexaceae bacterium]NJL33900.1 ribosome recycling factor [Chloroflexaceae bacterium]